MAVRLHVQFHPAACAQMSRSLRQVQNGFEFWLALKPIELLWLLGHLQLQAVHSLPMALMHSMLGQFLKCNDHVY